MSDSVPVVHQCPHKGASVTPCCGRMPSELPIIDRLTLDINEVTCKPSIPCRGDEWVRYLDETGHIKRYDGYCDCSYCQTVRKEFSRWIAEHPKAKEREQK